MNGQNSEHKIAIISDSFLRGCAENVKTYIGGPDRRKVCGSEWP